MKREFLFQLTCCAGPLLVACALSWSCYSYTVRTVMRQPPSSSGNSPFDSYMTSSNSLYSWKRPASVSDAAAVRKYYAVMWESGPLAEMNNMAVALAADERYFEAEIILKQALEETESEPALYNNLGIVYEMTGRAGPASLQYMRACILDDGNRRIRSNFLGLQEIPGK